MAKGDRIRVWNPSGSVTNQVEARQNGRTVDYVFEKEGGSTWIILQEKTRGGTLITEIRVPATEVGGLMVNKREIAGD